jgi:hypothetical protein
VQPANVLPRPTHERGSGGGASSDLSFTNDFSNLSLNGTTTTTRSDNRALTYGNAPTAQANPVGDYATSTGYRAHSVTTYPYGYPAQASYGWPLQPSYSTPVTNAYSATQHTTAYANHNPNYATAQFDLARPSDEELLQSVGRNVVLRPDAEHTPPDLLSLGVQPHMRLNSSKNTHGNSERLNTSCVPPIQS